jgi:multidrug efflux pump subunit AcrA (membrane-fusion protein)
MQASLMVLTAALALSGPPQSSANAPSLVDPKLDGLVMVKYDIAVPAQDAGVLVLRDAVEGMQVEEGGLLAKIDDTEMRMKRRIAEVELNQANRQAENDVDIRYSQMAAEVAKVDYRKSVAANQRVPGSVPDIELQYKELSWNKSLLQVQKSEFDQELAGMTAQAKLAEIEAADALIARRHITSPINGEVKEVYKQKGEWVSPGDPIFRLVSYDTLLVDGRLSKNYYNPSEIDGRPVTVEVEKAHGEVVRLPGKITYVDKEIQVGDMFLVRAEVENRKVDGHWLLESGHKATMTIQLQ